MRIGQCSIFSFLALILSFMSPHIQAATLGTLSGMNLDTAAEASLAMVTSLMSARHDRFQLRVVELWSGPLPTAAGPRRSTVH